VLTITTLRQYFTPRFVNTAMPDKRRSKARNLAVGRNGCSAPTSSPPVPIPVPTSAPAARAVCRRPKLTTPAKNMSLSAVGKRQAARNLFAGGGETDAVPMASGATGTRTGTAYYPTHCAPSRFKEVLPSTGTCLTPNELAQVAVRLGASEADANAYSATNPKALAAKLRETLNTPTGHEDRWLNMPQLRSDTQLLESLRNAFRPEHPTAWLRDPRYWLSSIDIENVMQQYEGHDGFHFMGVFPIDFATRRWNGACISEPMCRLNVRQMRAAGRTQLGIVLNMDRHDQKGSHWVGIYCGLNPSRRGRFGVWYYDSIADPPPPEAQQFMLGLRAQVAAEMGNPLGRRFRVEHNTVRRQFQNTECGIYAMLFILACCDTSRPFTALCRGMRNDDTIHALRHVLFRPPRM
jgi:hypothetical protein